MPTHISPSDQKPARLGAPTIDPRDAVRSGVTAASLRAVAAWNDEAGSTAYAASLQQSDADRREALLGEAARFWSQGERLRLSADFVALIAASQKAA